MPEEPSAQTSLFWKYFRTLFAAVVVALVVAGGSEAWLGYADQRARLSDLLDAEARLAAAKIEDFVEGIRDQMGWMVQLPWSDTPGDRRRLDALRLLNQAPAIASVTLIDGAGRERVFVSRIGLNRLEGGDDHSGRPAVIGARADRVWFSPVAFHDGSEPFVTIAVAGTRASAGIAVAEVNLKFIWEVVSAIRIGRTGDAFVLDGPGRLIAHPDISLVLQADEAGQQPLRALRSAMIARPGEAAAGRDIAGNRVMAAMVAIPSLGWTVVVAQPIAEAFAPIYAALWRTLVLMVAGAGLAAVLAYWLAQRMSGPIRQLEEGVARIGAGQLDHRISLRTGDELERLAARFNDMALDLSVSQERSERINRLKRFLAPQLAELIEQSGDDRVLDGRRVEVVAVFCDLRDFTAFSSRSEPETVMGVLRDYYDVLETVVGEHGATLMNFFGDGAMILLNAPVACPDPALRAVRMAIDMQHRVHDLLSGWHMLEGQLGFGIGLAMGPATVGQIGSDGRLHYTAIGNVVNLASRLCSSAEDSQILVDRGTADAVGASVAVAALGERALKGFDEPVPVFAVVERGQGRRQA